MDVIGRPPKYPDGTERVTVRLPKPLLRAIRQKGGNVSEVIINALRKVFK
jgi:Arc/MetJ-type ribon-helix-helix transcriptional regulator